MTEDKPSYKAVTDVYCVDTLLYRVVNDCVNVPAVDCKVVTEAKTGVAPSVNVLRAVLRPAINGT